MFEVDGRRQPVVAVDDRVGERLTYGDLGEIGDLDLLPVRQRERGDVPSSPDQLHGAFERDHQRLVDSFNRSCLTGRSWSVLIEDRCGRGVVRLAEEDFTGPQQFPMLIENAEGAQEVFVAERRQRMTLVRNTAKGLTSGGESAR